MTQEQEKRVKEIITELENLGLAGYLSLQPKEEEKAIFTIFEIGAPKKPK